MKKICIFNLKGGIGKTTTAENMAYILAKTYKKRVLICDLDASGNISTLFGARPTSGDNQGLASILMDRDADPKDYIRHTEYEGLDILVGNDALKTADSCIRQETRFPQQFRLRAQLKKIKDEYDYCIMDCPCSEDSIVINALACADEVIIPALVCSLAIDAIIRVQHLVQMVSEYNENITIRGILLIGIRRTRLDRVGLGLSVPGIDKFNTYIRDSIGVRESHTSCKPLREYLEEDRAAHKSCAAPSMDYENFVAEYLGRPYVHEDAPYCKSNNT